MEIVAALIGTAGGVLVAVIGIFGAVKLGVGTSQEKLVEALQGLIDVDEKKIKVLQDQIAEYQQQVAKLNERVQNLETLTISQAEEINQLRKQVRDLPTRGEG